MPWTLKDVDSHYKGLTAAQKAQWLAVANNALAACQKKGGTNCDASAIQQANGVVNKNKKTEAQLEAASIIVEVGRSISAANGSKIDAALKLMASAMETINTLINDTQQEALINVGSSDAPIMLTSKYDAWETWSFDEASKILAKSDSFDSRRLSVQGALRRRALTDYATQKLSDMSSGSDGGDYYDMYDCGPMPWIRDLYDDYVVYSLGSELYQSGYTINGTDVTLDDPVDVQISYVPKPTTTNNESIIPLLGEIIVLEEKAVSSDGKVQVKLISPGWGSSGYYSAKMLERDGPKVFKKGLHMYMNHPTEEEDKNRPERDLRDLVGVQEEDAKWLPNGPTGPGLYATASVFSPYREFIDEAAPFIGTSIRAGGRATEGEAEGRHGPIVESLEEGYSVDYVTLPGRGGQVLPLLEAARSRLLQEAASASDYAYVPDASKPSTWKLNISDKAHVAAACAALGSGFRGQKVEIPSSALAGVKAKVRAAWKKFNPDKTAMDMPDSIKESGIIEVASEVKEVDEKEAQALRESVSKLTETNTTMNEALTRANESIARMNERLIISDARTIVSGVLAGIQMSDMTRARLNESCVMNPPLKDGALDVDVLTTRVKEAAKTELEYLAAVVPTTSGGAVVGMGASTISVEDADKTISEAFGSIFDGDKKLAEVAAKGRN